MPGVVAKKFNHFTSFMIKIIFEFIYYATKVCIYIKLKFKIEKWRLFKLKQINQIIWTWISQWFFFFVLVGACQVFLSQLGLPNKFQQHIGQLNPFSIFSLHNFCDICQQSKIQSQQCNSVYNCALKNCKWIWTLWLKS